MAGWHVPCTGAAGGGAWSAWGPAFPALNSRLPHLPSQLGINRGHPAGFGGTAETGSRLSALSLAPTHPDGHLQSPGGHGQAHWLEPRLCARSSNPTPVLCLSQVREYKVPSKRALGPILLIRLHKEPYSFFPENMWYCNTVRVTSPEGNTYCFPCYRWIQGYRTVELAESTAKSLFMQADASGGRGAENWRSRRWICPVCGIGYWVLAPTSSAVGEVGQRAGPVARETDKWGPVCVSPEYVTKHWQEDAFFGYQYLNGFNPVLIRKCTALPENFPVTQEMVAGSLGESTSLQEELQVTPLNGHQQYIAAPLCLLHQKPSGEVVPLAIQLSQHPGPDSPIFLPSDSEWLWTLAKTWVRNSEFHLHEVTSHLLRAHLLAEVFAVATQRQLPMCHPLYKLLIPHVRFSIHIDVLARTFLISPGGVFDRAIATGRRGLAVLLRKALENLTYRTLCLPDDIQERGVVLYGRKPCIRGLFCWDPANILSHTKLGFVPGPHPQSLFWLSPWLCAVSVSVSLACRAPPLSAPVPLLSQIPRENLSCLGVIRMQPLGTYPDEHFTEHGPKQLMAAFQDRLAEISQEIEERNRSLSLSYNYMYPPNIENSTAI
uniref:Arachidonate lipoxygenase 3 n=1 Tax=Chelonoidis abingdonii TaxID=106734 RepID=A0A8C0IQZ2_CHEAB